MRFKNRIAAAIAGFTGKSIPGLGGWRDIFGSGEASGSAKLNRPYGQSVWVMRAIKYVSGPIESVPLVFTEDARGGDKVIDDPKLTAFWERPCRTRSGLMSREQFIAAAVGWLKLTGEVFLILDETWLVRGATKSPLIMARPDDMRPILDGDRILVGWFWTDGSGQRHALPSELVRWQKLWNPYDEIRGLSEWEAAEVASKADYAQGVFARNLAENNGDRGPYVIGKNGVATPEQQKQITAMLKQKQELSRRGIFRAIFLTGDIEVKEPTLQSVDASYVAQRLENKHEIFLAFGVPPSFADVTASYSIGSASDRAKLIEETCMPTGALIGGLIEEITSLFLGDGRTIFVEFDFNSHSVMQQVRAERFKSATDGVDRGIPWKIAGEYFRLKLPRFPGDDVGRVPFNLTEIGAPDPAAAAPPQKSVKGVADELEGLFARKSLKPVAKGQANPGAWERIHRSRKPWEKRFKTKVSALLMQARTETLRKIDATKADEAPLKGKSLDALSLIFDLTPWLGDWIKGLSDVSGNALQAAGLELWKDELGRDDALTMPAAEVVVALANRQNRLSGAGTQIWDQVRGELQVGIEKGETMDQLSDRIRAAFNGIDKSRADMIATTETTVAYETGRDMVFRAAGIQWTQWLVSGLGNSRHSHLAADGQIREAGTPFNVGGFELKFPGDPDAPAKEVINCNCVRIAVGGPDGNDINNDDSIPY